MSKSVIKQGVQQEARALSGRGGEPIKVHKATVRAADLTAAATSEAIDISTGDDGTDFPANAYVITAACRTLEAWSGTGISGTTLDIGDSGNPDELIDGANVHAVGYDSTPKGVYTPWTAEATAYVPLATVIAAGGGNVSAYDTGATEIFIYYFCPEDPGAP